jgi:hypothetical protein
LMIELSARVSSMVFAVFCSLMFSLLSNDYGTTLMLEPRLQRALLTSILPIVQGTVNLPGSLCLDGSFLCKNILHSSLSFFFLMSWELFSEFDISFLSCYSSLNSI